jgi:hypothetical protein
LEDEIKCRSEEVYEMNSKLIVLEFEKNAAEGKKVDNSESARE